MQDDPQILLGQALQRRCAAVLSLPCDGAIRHHKSRLLAGDEQGIWMARPAGDAQLIDRLREKQHPVGVVFKLDPYKLAFATTIEQMHPTYPADPDLALPALRLRPPVEIRSLQRRLDYRVPVPEDCGLRADIWRISDRADLRDRPMSAQLLPASVRDLSRGGMGLLIQWPDQASAVKLVNHQRLRVELRYADLSLLLEGRLRVPEKPSGNGPVHMGLRFVTADDSIAARRNRVALTRIVGDLQRQEIRRSTQPAPGSSG